MTSVPPVFIECATMEPDLVISRLITYILRPLMGKAPQYCISNLGNVMRPCNIKEMFTSWPIRGISPRIP